MPIRTLLIDNYDSYTYNLFQLIAEVNGELPTVLRNNDVDLPTLLRRIEAKEFDNIVISPGPGTPERAVDVGVSLQLLQAKLPVPTLGVCLGFQALALAHGGSVCHAPEPVHGRLSSVDHSGHPLFAGIPSGPAYAVVRYHSLLVEEASLPPCLQAIAWTCGQHHALQLEAVSAGPSGGSVVHGEPAASASPQQQHQHQEQQQQQQQQGTRLLMAIAHRSLPHWGVQFHPESVATGYGVALLRNFAAMTHVYHGLPLPATPPSLLARLAGPPGSPLPPLPWDRQPGSLRLHHSKLPGLLAACGGSEALFWHLFGGGNSGSTPGSMDSTAAADTFWLDSVTTDRARFSFMGGRGGGLWRRIEYRLASPQTSHPEPAAAAGAAAAAEVGGAEAGSDNAAAAAAENTVRQPSSNNSASSGSIRPGTLTLTAADGQREVLSTDFFGWLEGLLASHRCQVSPEDAAALPFNFWGGLVGYLGYELKAECGGRAAHRSPTPDAAFFMADRQLAVDHLKGDVYLVALSEPDSKQSQAEAQQWVEQLAEQVHGLAASPPARKGQLTRRPLLPQQQVTQPPHQQQHPQQQQQQQKRQANGACSNGLKACCDSAAKAAANGGAERAPQAPFCAREGRRRYLQNISSCLEALYNGDSYEVCLTTRLSRRGAPDAARLYRTLRRINPAPYAAWLRFGPGALQLCCCSPERFLRGDRGGQLEAKPIKGTAPRSADPQQDQRSAAELAASEKDRAENLMIVDLLRNDLGRVCTPGSVHVPHLMCIESYATVHQMVSTVRGQRRPGATIVDCLRAAFPGGSMTGAPKIRTMEIIDGLEQGPRGVYSGSLGYISFNDTFDLNIVIRTAAITPAPGEEAAGASEISIGAGGAIVVQSDPEGEVEEMRLKARALLRAIGECDGGSGPAAVEDDDS